MKKNNQISKKLNLSKKVVIYLDKNQVSRIRTAAFDTGNSMCACKSASPGQACPSVDCTTVPTVACG